MPPSRSVTARRNIAKQSRSSRPGETPGDLRYDSPVLRALAVVIAIASVAYADGTVIVGGSPRAIGRAGTGTVGDDGAGALLVNPAAMARRDGKRVQLGFAFVDDGVDWRSDADGAPVVHDQIGSLPVPTIAAE